MGGQRRVASYQSRKIIALVMQVSRVQTFANRFGVAFLASLAGSHNYRPEAES